tara:strand:+ start:5843 stop:6094 length:252 start_codon:yes stop_codon:yes gene_type:complete
MLDYYSIFILVHLLFNPIGQAGGETAGIQGVYTNGQQCVDAMEALEKLKTNPLEKWGCVEAVHPADERMMRKNEQERHEEGSH